MGFFSDLGRKTSETTGKIAKETKLKIKINENKGKITDIYEEIGKKVYEKHIREENIDIKVDLEEECSKIDELSQEIEEARLEILKLNQKRLCSKCGAEIEKGAAFCPKCGEKQPVEEVKVAEVVDANAADSAETPKTEENAEAENTVEKVTEVMSQETQENAKEEMGGNTDNQ